MLNTQDIYIRGLRDLRAGALILAVALAISIATSIISDTYHFDIETYLSSIDHEDPEEIQRIHGLLEEIANILIIALVIMVFMLVIQLIAYSVKIAPGASKLAKVDSDYSTPSTLIKVGYIAGLITLIIGLTVVVLTVIHGVFTLDISVLILGLLGGVILLVVSYILLIIGKIGLIMLVFKLGDKEAQSDYKIVAVLFIISLVLTMIRIAIQEIYLVSEAIDMVAFILLFFALNKSIRQRTTMPSILPIRL